MGKDCSNAVFFFVLKINTNLVALYKYLFVHLQRQKLLMFRGFAASPFVKAFFMRKSEQKTSAFYPVLLL